MVVHLKDQRFAEMWIETLWEKVENGLFDILTQLKQSIFKKIGLPP